MHPSPLVLLLVAAALTACGGAADPRTPSPSALPTSQAPVPEPVDPLSPKPAVESPAPTAASRDCDASRLTIADADLLADEHELQEVFVIRTSGPLCALRGWPAVTLLDAQGAPLTVTQRREGTPVTVTLDPSTSLSFVLATPRTQDCRDVSTVAVRLPGTDRTIRAQTTMQVCDRSLTVSPVERRTDDEGSEH